MNTLLSSPHTALNSNVTRMMLLVVMALIPAYASYVYYFGYGVLINAGICTLAALLSEALMLRIRQRPLWPFLTDGSAVVTALLLAIGLPPLFPWWLAVVATVFAIVIAKHLYGGLGYNPFNPAMVGYALLLIAFPKDMTYWLPVQQPESTMTFLANLHFNLYGVLPTADNLDGVTTATPLDLVRTQQLAGLTLEQIQQTYPSLASGLFGHGWDVINGMFLLGGIFLLYKRVINWRIPVSMLLTITALASIAYLIDSTNQPMPWFHLLGGATMIGAFFIATDPVTASTTPRGQLIYGCGVGVFTFLIRGFGGYPDGLAFAILLMNLAAPLIDHYTQPRTFGHPPGGKP